MDILLLLAGSQRCSFQSPRWQDVTQSIASSHLSSGAPLHMGPPFPYCGTVTERALWFLFFAPAEEEVGLTTLPSHLQPPMSQIFHRGLCKAYGLWWLSSQGPASKRHPHHPLNTFISKTCKHSSCMSHLLVFVNTVCLLVQIVLLFVRGGQCVCTQCVHSMFLFGFLLP